MGFSEGLVSGMVTGMVTGMLVSIHTVTVTVLVMVLVMVTATGMVKATVGVFRKNPIDALRSLGYFLLRAMGAPNQKSKGILL